MTSGAVLRGEIWWLDWGPGRGSEQAGRRPCLVIQNDTGNAFGATTIVATVTIRQRDYPFMVALSANESGLHRRSYVNLSQLQTVDKARLLRRAGRLRERTMTRVDAAIRISLGLG